MRCKKCKKTKTKLLTTAAARRRTQSALRQIKRNNEKPNSYKWQLVKRNNCFYVKCYSYTHVYIHVCMCKCSYAFARRIMCGRQFDAHATWSAADWTRRVAGQIKSALAIFFYSRIDLISISMNKWVQQKKN